MPCHQSRRTAWGRVWRLSTKSQTFLQISGDEIVLEVYIGDEDHPYYRMNVDGSELRKIGQVSDEFPWEEE